MTYLTYSVANPPFEAPDEIWHYAYAHWYAAGNGLPEPADFGAAPWAQEGSQPPLYYLLASLPLRLLSDAGVEEVRYNPHAAPGDGAAWGNRNMVVHAGQEGWPWQGPALGLHLVRFVSILLGAATVWFTFAIARLALPGWPPAAVPPAMLVAFNPQFLFIHAAASNDTLVTALCTAGIWATLAGLAVQPRLDGARRWAWWGALGLLIGIAALSKVHGLLLGLLVAPALAYTAWQVRSWHRTRRWK